MQKKSHEALLHLLNNIGVVGAVLAAIADIVFVLIMVFGIEIKVELSAMIIFAVVNAIVGILITVLLRYQGQKYAEIENEELCRRYYNKKVREKKYMSMVKWQVLNGLQDVVIKGATTAFSIFGIIYISITGSKNPIQILIALATLLLFACFGLIGMNSAYCRYYNIQVPYMNMKLEERANEPKKRKAKQDTKHSSKRTKARNKAQDKTVDNSSKNSMEGLADRGHVPMLSCSLECTTVQENEVKIDDNIQQQAI